MKTDTFRHLGLACACMLAVTGGSALAKLPEPSPEAKAKAAEAKAKADHATKVGAYKLCQAQDKVAAQYYERMKTAGKETKPAVSTAACADPGPMPPIEQAGAHSPPQPAAQPHNSPAPQSSIGSPSCSPLPQRSSSCVSK